MYHSVTVYVQEDGFTITTQATYTNNPNCPVTTLAALLAMSCGCAGLGVLGCGGGLGVAGILH